MAKEKSSTKRTVGGTRKTGSTEPKQKVVKKPHPLIGSKDADVYPFSETPEDFDPKTMKPLGVKDFKGKAQWLNYRAELLEAKAAELREQAEEVAKHGDKSQRKRVNKLKKLREQQAELMKVLAEQGVDVDAVLAEDEDDSEE